MVAAVVLVLAVAGFWLLTPHLVSDQVAEVVGEVPQGAIAELATGADASPGRDASLYSFHLGVTNSGLLPVTLSEPWIGQLSGTARVQSVDLGLTPTRGGAGQYAAELTLQPGEQAFVHITIYGSECSDSGSSESLTTIEDVILRAQVGPFARNVRLSAWATMQVVTQDGSALPPCP